MIRSFKDTSPSIGANSYIQKPVDIPSSDVRAELVKLKKLGVVYSTGKTRAPGGGAHPIWTAICSSRPDARTNRTAAAAALEAR